MTVDGMYKAQTQHRQLFQGDLVQPPNPASGMRDFDFFVGTWRVHHRQLKRRLAGCAEWIEFGGTAVARPLLDGAANFDDNLLELPSGAYRAVTLRAFDANTNQWSIWWLDGRSPLGPLDPPVRGGFQHGIGTFYADDSFEGKPIRMRFIWSRMARGSCQWEQAFSNDRGLHWETNWIMNFTRTE
jgi:hypothetical protein